MLRAFKKHADQAALDRVRDWTRTRFALPDDTTILVTELACTLPGCAPCTAPIPSKAGTVAEIIEELQRTKSSERAGRAQDKESEDAFEKLRRDGYM